MLTRRLSVFVIVIGLLAWAVIAVFAVADPARMLLPAPTAQPSPTVIPTRIAVLPTDPPTLIPTVPPTITPLVSLPTASPTTTLVVSKTATPTPIPIISATPKAPGDPATAISTTTIPATIAPDLPAVTVAVPANVTSAPCQPPTGWTTYTVTDGDTLFGFQLGSKNTATVDQIMQGNCLKSKLLMLGQVIYLPPGAGQNAPKVDDGPAGGPELPAGLSRTANCPCTLSIRAGWRREQIAAALDTIPVGFTGRDFLAVTNAGVPIEGFGFLASKPGGVSLEGFLYPGTYTLQNDTSAAGLRDMMLRAFDGAIPDGLRNDAAARGLTFYQAVVLASIVQRESYAPVEQVQIASVMYNRMAAGKALSSTVTVQYAVGRAGAWWPKVTGSDLKNRSKYNTYIWLGLPPTPISNPNFDALNSTIHPAQTDYQYFNGRCDGPGNFYTATYAEFEVKLKVCGVLK